MLNVLAVDLGASNGRVMRAEFSGDSLALQEVHRFVNQPRRFGNRLQWNFPDIYAQVTAGITKAGNQHGDIASIAVDSWAVDYGLIDTAGNLIDMPMHYRDKRNLTAMEDLLSRISPKDLFQRTGIQLLPLNTIFQVYAMMRENPEHLKAADKLLLMPDLINFYLTGVKRAEFTNATTTQLLNGQTGQWDREILSLLGVNDEVFPTIVSPGTMAGPITDQGLRHLSSLRRTQIVHTASHDTASAVVAVPNAVVAVPNAVAAVPNQSDSYVYISSGTWSLMGTVVPTPDTSDKAQAYNFTNEGGVGNYRLLKNVMGLWIVQEIQRDLISRGEPSDIVHLLHEAGRAPAFTFLFDPDDFRLLQPDNMAVAIRDICREFAQPEPRDTGTLLRGIFECIALKYRSVLEQLQDVTGVTYEVIHVVGGGSRNGLLCQFAANATGLPVIAGPVEASALGNALVQLQAVGEIKSQKDMKELVKRSFQPVTYTPEDQTLWQEAYGRFLKVVSQLANQQHRGE